MDKPVDNPPVRYDIATLRRLQRTLERVAMETDEAGVPEEAQDLRLAASFLGDTAAVLEKQRENLRHRRRLEARDRRAWKRQNRKK